MVSAHDEEVKSMMQKYESKVEELLDGKDEEHRQRIREEHANFDQMRVNNHAKLTQEIYEDIQSVLKAKFREQ
jgi:hypothetical protein